jgi:hypothetical protein
MVAPSLPVAPPEYDKEYMDQLTRILRLYFNTLDNPSTIKGAGLNLNINSLPTQASTTLRSGDVYRDTSAANVLKIKT